MSKTASPAGAKPAAKPESKPAAKPADPKAAGTKPAAAKAGAKPGTATAAKPAGDAALPDAALLDREGGDETAAAAPAGLRRFLPTTKVGWALAASLAISLIGSAATGIALYRPAKPVLVSPNIVGPAKVINGRMMVVAGQTVRLQAIDAPPAELICRDGVWEYKCGADSRKALEQIVGSRPVDCEPAYTDTAEKIVHAVCHSDQGVDIAAALVASGWAVADLRRSSRYFPQQAKAQDEGLGLWRNNFAYPEQWRLAARGER